jgi:hypothetical protein
MDKENFQPVTTGYIPSFFRGRGYAM